MDAIDFGEVYVSTAIDTYTGEGQVVLLPCLTSGDGASAIQRVMDHFGGCEVMQTDGSVEFAGEFAGTLPRYTGRHRVARPYRRNEQPYIERFNRSVRHKCLGWTKCWPQRIPELHEHL